MNTIWKWILRPIVIAVAGVTGVNSIAEAPLFGVIFVLVSAAGVIWLLRDIYLYVLQLGVF